MCGFNGGKQQGRALKVVVQMVRRSRAAVQPVAEQLGQVGVHPDGLLPQGQVMRLGFLAVFTAQNAQAALVQFQCSALALGAEILFRPVAQGGGIRPGSLIKTADTILMRIVTSTVLSPAYSAHGGFQVSL